ncbi:helix-turn-helix domain-containing protein [Streptomyces sp. NPDC048281]|uniref:nSTAND1 domain-containing NTPase n=1 Tax=Streptomyces sp. NPDC048281 TaxID=3154715 RepID=UPI0034343B36
MTPTAPPPASASAHGPDETTAPGRRLHQLRKHHQPQPVSLKWLADRAGYTKGYLSKIETGEKPLTTDVARACDRVLGTGGELTRLVQDLTGRLPVAEDAADVCPYPGLASFEASDADWFFGRDQATAALAGRLADALGAGGLSVVVAPSGAGKSSLLRAGLVPALARGALPARGSRQWPVKVFTPGRQPLETLLEILEQTVGLPVSLARAALRRGRGHALGALVRRRTRPAAGPEIAGTGGEVPGTVRPVLIIDQFEELFTHCDSDGHRDDFLTALDALVSPAPPGGRTAGPAALVVLGIRADYYGHCLAHPRLAGHMAAGHLPLAPMSPADLRTVIVEPAARCGLTLEPGLAEVILRDAGAHRGVGADSTGALPLLAHALRATWQQRTGTTLTVDGYTTSGGIHSAIEASAERAYNSLAPHAQQAAHQLLLRLVHLDHDGRATRRRLALQPSAAHGPDPTATHDAVEAFTRARLLTLDTDHVTIAHETLLTAWPRLRDWITADRDGLHTRQQLAEAADQWDQTGRDPDLLYRGSRLTIAQDWADRHPWTSGSPLAGFLDASQNRQDADTRRERRTLKHLRRAVVALSLLLMVTTAVMGVCYVMWNKVQDQDERARRLRAQRTEQENRRKMAELKADLIGKLSDPPVSIRCPTPTANGDMGWCAAIGGKLLTGGDTGDQDIIVPPTRTRP